MEGPAKKNLLIYGDPNHQTGIPLKRTLEASGYDVTLEPTRGAFRLPEMLEKILIRVKPDLVIAGSHLDPSYNRVFERISTPVMLLSTRSEAELERDPRITAWRTSSALKTIAKNDRVADILPAVEAILKEIEGQKPANIVPTQRTL